MRLEKKVRTRGCKMLVESMLCFYSNFQLPIYNGPLLQIFKVPVRGKIRLEDPTYMLYCPLCSAHF